MTVREALRDAARLLSAKGGSDEAHLEAELLLAHTLRVDHVHLYQRLNDELPARKERAYRALLARRLAHEPTAYILGRREFYGLELEVTPAAIIPRPETEVLVELLVAYARERFGGAPFTLVDVGAGCGAIAIAAASELPSARVVATDLSAAALALARRNARRHRLGRRIRFLQGDLLEPPSARPDIIAANLPYVPTATWKRLPPEIREHEPRDGLDGGPDGLRVIERLLRQAPDRLRPGGALFAEIGDEQGPAVREIAADAFPQASIEVAKDLAGLDRVLVVYT